MLMVNKDYHYCKRERLCDNHLDDLFDQVHLQWIPKKNISGHGTRNLEPQRDSGHMVENLT